jgi:hypothetical protein
MGAQTRQQDHSAYTVSHLAVVHAVQASLGPAVLDADTRDWVALIVTDPHHEHVGPLPLAIDCQLGKHGAHLQKTQMP